MASAERTYAPQETINPNFDVRKDAEFVHRSEVVRGLEPFVAKNLSLLRKPSEIWQPIDLIPVDFTHPGWRTKIKAIQEQAADVPEEIFNCLVVHTTTEEGLPSYLGRLGQFDAIRDRTGTDDTPWAQWNRGWTAEEYGHGQVLMLYLRTSGRVKMRAVEETNRRLIESGFNMNVEDPYEFIIYTTWQEVATAVAHKNVGNAAKSAGDSYLKEICSKITADEGRHAEFYKRIGREITRQDPNGSVLSFWNIMQKGVVMPGRLIDDGFSRDKEGLPDTFKKFGDLANSVGIFTVEQIANIWQVTAEELGVLTAPVSEHAAIAQEKVVRRLKVFQRAGAIDRETKKKKIPEPATFGWTLATKD